LAARPAAVLRLARRKHYFDAVALAGAVLVPAGRSLDHDGG
jgi:hypothetical protein